MNTLIRSQTLLTVFAFFFLSLPALTFADEPAEKLAAFMDDFERQEGFNGSVIICLDDKTIFKKGYGLANREHHVANQPKTKFRIGSITKQFTAMGIMILDEQQKLSIDDSVSDYIDESPNAWKPITIHHLLTHTSGIPSFTGMKEYRRDMMLPQTTAQMIARFKDKPLLFEPGKKFDYSNSGYFLLGAIIEETSGKSYEQFLRDEILAPLDLDETGYDRFQTILKHRASGYRLWTPEVSHDAYIHMTQPFSAGAMYSTVEDLARWDQALRRGKLISPDRYEKMYTPAKNSYAYGWSVRHRQGKRVLSHGGGINGFVSHILRYPDENLCVVVLCNVQPSNPQKVAQGLADIILSQRDRDATSPDTERLNPNQSSPSPESSQ